MNINYLSDFKILEGLKDGTSILSAPFRFTYYVKMDKGVYVAEYNGSEFTNCRPTADGRVVVPFDHPQLGLGELMVKREFYLTDSDFKDGICNLVSVESTGITLDKGATDDGDVAVELFPYYQKGDKGDKMTYDDLTEEEKEDLAKKVIGDAEDERRAAEIVRQENEVARVTAENQRRLAETGREETFVANETQREQTFEANEDERQSTFTANEVLRQDAEVVREANEKRREETFEDVKQSINKIKDGDTIVGQAREIHSRNGKVVTDSFLVRTTAGSGTIGDGVATLKSVGGNIVKNLVDGLSSDGFSVSGGTKSFVNGVISFESKSTEGRGSIRNYQTPKKTEVSNHVYYQACALRCTVTPTKNQVFIGWGALANIYPTGHAATAQAHTDWQWVSTMYTSFNTSDYHSVVIGDKRTSNWGKIYVKNYFHIDLTELFGAGNEPTKEECDRLFGTMDALPQGLTIAQPTTFKSTGFNQFNPENILDGKAIVDNAIENGDKKIAIIPCLPCKVGVGENNGYCIHGEFGEDIKVYFTPLNPMEVDGELYMHELVKDATTDTYVPQIKGYMLVEVPTVANLCAHFLWSEDKCERGTYEPYYESEIKLHTIPQMSEYGLAGISSSGTLVCDEIDFERGVYIKRIGSVDLGSLEWLAGSSSIFYTHSVVGSVKAPEYGKTANAITDVYNIQHAAFVDSGHLLNMQYMIYSNGNIYVKDERFTVINDFKAANQGVILYYELAIPEEYPLPKIDNNYISSDYGVEQFDAKVPCNANNLYYMRSLAGETRNFLDRMYDNTDKTDAKEVADYITSGIESNKELATNAPNLALRALFVAAGAAYNDTGNYELNGIADLTESDMIYIYEHKNYHFSLNTARYFQENKNVRTIFPMNTANTVYDQLFKNNKLSLVYTFQNSNIEVIKFSKSQTLRLAKGIPTESGSMVDMFTNAKKLKTIYPIDVSAVTSIGTSFDGTIALIDVRLFGLKCSAIFKDSTNISKESVLYTIQNATPTSAITITLHPDAYARLADDADIVAALEEKNAALAAEGKGGSISLVSA